MTKSSRKKLRPIKVGTQIICEATKKMVNRSMKKINGKKRAKAQKSKKIKQEKQEENVKGWYKENIIPLEKIAFDFQLKNRCHKTVDYALQRGHDSASVSCQIHEPFQNIKTHNQNGEGIKLSDNNTYLTYLHQVNNATNPMSSFAFVSGTILQDFKELELFMREDLIDSNSDVKSCYFTVTYLCPIELSYQDLLEIYNFNTGFFKDVLQDSNNVQQFDFNTFLESKSSIKFLLVLLNQQFSKANAKNFFSKEFQDQSLYMNQKMVSEGSYYESHQSLDLIDFILMQRFNNQKKKELNDQSYQLTSIFNKYKSDLEMDVQFSEIQTELNILKEIQNLQQNKNEKIFNCKTNEGEKQQQADQKSLENIKWKEEKQRKILDGNEYRETEILQKIPTVLKNNKFKQMIETNMFRHAFFAQDFFQIVDVFDTCTTTIGQFIESYSHNTKMSCEQVLCKLSLRKEIPKEDYERDTLYDVIYKNPNKYLTNSTQLFFLIRKHFMHSQENSHSEQNNDNKLQQNNKPSSEPQKKLNYQFECPIFNRKNPLVLCKKAHHLKNFDFLNDYHIKNNKFVYQTIIDRDFSDSKLNLFIFPLEHLSMSILPSPTIDSLLQSSSIFSLIKDIMVVKGFSENFNLQDNLNFELLIESFSFLSYSKTKNLELLEVIGDVVIKYLSSLYLVHHLPCQTENILTVIRSFFINNKYLGITAFYNGLHFYAQTKRPNSYDWRFNLFNQSSFDDVSTENNKQSYISQINLFLCLVFNLLNRQTNALNYSNLSDMLESVMGTIFASNNFTLQACLQFSKKLGLKIDKNLTNQCFTQVQGSFMILNEYMDQLEITEDLTYLELYQLKPKQRVSQYENNLNFPEEENLFFKPQNLYDNFVQEKYKNTKQDSKKIFIWNLIYFYIEKEIYFENQYKVEYINNTDPNQRRRDRTEYKKFKQLHEQTLDNVLESFERNINYKFKDRQLLIKALNCRSNPQFAMYAQDYQILEFLGDAIIEILVVSNGYNITRNKNNQIKTPYFFCELKSLLLSNDFMSRLAVLHNYHYYALSILKYQQDEILSFIQDSDLNTKFRDPVTHQSNSPKILGDLWESVAGAIIMDSNIDTFVQIYGKLYAPYIKHFSIYYDKIIFNVKEKVQLVAQQTYSQLGKETEVIIEADGVQKIKVGSGIDLQESLAEKKAYQDAYENIFIKKITNLGLVYQGKKV